MSPEKHYKTREVAELLSVHEDTIRRMVARGDLAAIIVGRDLRISESSLQRYLADHKAPSVRGVL